MPNPDMILYNGTIYPKTDSQHSVRAIAVWNGQVTDVGSDLDILKLRGTSVQTIDLSGQVVIPGLSDSHIHLLGYGMLLRTLDLSKARSISEIQRVVAKASKKIAKGGWIVGRGWDQERLREHRYPNRDDISLVPQPVFLRRICGHVAVANTPALERAGITGTDPDHSFGLIEQEPSTGEPTGVLKEGALELVQRLIPQKESEVEEALLSAARKLLRVGLTSLHCIIENVLELRVLRRLKYLGKIRQSVYAIIPLSLLDKAVDAGMRTEIGPGGFRIGGVKVFLDGSLGARTAALTEPYDDDCSTGLLTIERNELDEAAEKASVSGFQLSIHAIGDRAVEQAVGAIERARRLQNGKEPRHRIEHLSFTPSRLLSRLRRNRVVASVQPGFITSDSWAEKRLGPGRVQYLYPFRSMLQAGIPLAAGSDCPVEDPNPFRGVWSAAARPGLAGGERLTVAQSLTSYTLGSAYASFSETFRGNLEPGKAADLIILDRDPFKCPIDELRKVKVLQTIIAGELVFQSSAL